jgi:hypothetical protein
MVFVGKHVAISTRKNVEIPNPWFAAVSIIMENGRLIWPIQATTLRGKRSTNRVRVSPLPQKLDKIRVSHPAWLCVWGTGKHKEFPSAHVNLWEYFGGKIKGAGADLKYKTVRSERSTDKEKEALAKKAAREKKNKEEESAAKERIAAAGGKRWRGRPGHEWSILRVLMPRAW